MASAHRRVVVVGGSLAGLLAARVLADHFDRVTVLERDRYPEGPHPRKGVPQAKHLHALLLRGRQLLEEYFPGFGTQMAEAGAPRFDVARDVAWLTPAGWGVRYESGLEMIAFTRDLLDWLVRRRLAAWSNVELRQGVDVTGLLPDARGTCVGGVVIQDRGTGGVERLSAELVVDASGRGSRLPQWLNSLGYAAPAETVVNAGLGYATRLYHEPAKLPGDWRAVAVQAAPPRRGRAGILLPVEGGRFMLTLSGAGDDRPPTDEADFLEFARGLASPMAYDAIKDAEPASPITGYSGTGNRLRHCERLPAWPERLVALGDSVCAFNPVYGQGMTTAALGADLLGRLLMQRRRGSGHDLRGLARQFQKQLARVNVAPWTLAPSEDLYYPNVVGGRRTGGTERMHWYVTQVLRLATERPDVRHRFLEVFHMLRPPASLLHPSVMAQALWRGLTRPVGSVPEVRPAPTSALVAAPPRCLQYLISTGHSEVRRS
jgi:2-polyprenyl-6-methoxyphenol hydroxylase-like FAD-dependent oxidoreductase